ncbi:MAG TPA: TonB-dependent receptor [Steroidobacteraceae bacterium]|nr:TonB-dependent receptor [Steroidobacteraceae bacterium]
MCARVALAATVGEPLTTALADLERRGLTLIWSSVLVTPDLRVTADPGRGAAEDVARRLLAPHGLALRPIRAGTFAIVRAEEVAAPAEKPAAGPDTPASPEAPLEEIAVYASRYRVSTQRVAGAAELSRDDIEALPGLDQDVLRVTKYLPGTATNGVSSRPYVRGGRQSELAVYYDGIPLFEPFHFKDFQGLLGVLDPAVVDSMDFYSGVLPVRFGDRLSGALDIVPRRADDTDRWIFGLSPLFLSAVTSGRTDQHGLEWLGAARVSSLGLVDEVNDRIGDPDFTDVLGRVELPVGDRNKLVAGWLLLDDKLDFDASDDESATASYRDATGWLRGEFALADRWRLDTALSHTERHTTRRGSIARDNAFGSVDDVRRHDASTLRAELSHSVRHAQLAVGIEAAHYVSEYEYRSDAMFEPRFAAAFGRPQSVAYARNLDTGGDSYAAYLLYAWQPLDALTMSGGLRWDGQRYDGFDANQFSPRLLLEWHPLPRWRFRAAFGRTHQSERPDELQIQDAEPVFHEVQRAEQGVLAVEHQLHEDWSLRVEAFRKRVYDPVPIYENLLDALVPLPELEVDRVRVAPTGASAYGVESTLRWQPAERWAGWLAYSWTESQDEFPGFKVARTWDQRNAVNAGLSWTRRPWQLSGTLQWRSGWRRNALRLVDADTGEIELLPRNGLAYPRTTSIDLRATWTMALRASALHFYVDVNNAGNRQTPCCTSYSLTQDDGAWTLNRDYDSTFPRYVLLGVNWEIP